MSIFYILLFNLLTITRNVDKMYCDIKGNIKNPGVYEVVPGEVINDIIEKAGGLKKNSYIKNINLSKKVTDEMVINILSIDEYEDLTYECPICECESIKCDDKTNEETTTTANINTTITTTKEITTTKSNTTLKIVTTTESLKLININTATIDELMKLSGIGESKAQAILLYREENGLFKSIDELKNVKGIGEKLFESIKEFITV